jgi:hypothetical protein
MELQMKKITDIRAREPQVPCEMNIDPQPVQCVHLCTTDVGHTSLTSQSSFCTDLSCETSDFIGEETQAFGHAIDSLLQLLNLATQVDFNLLRQVTTSLAGPIHGHEVNIICKNL